MSELKEELTQEQKQQFLENVQANKTMLELQKLEVDLEIAKLQYIKMREDIQMQMIDNAKTLNNDELVNQLTESYIAQAIKNVPTN